MSVNIKILQLHPDDEEWTNFVNWLNNAKIEENDTIGKMYRKFREEER